MSWICKECGVKNPDSAYVCEGCGKNLRSILRFKGPARSVTFHIATRVGRTLYKRLLEDTASYVDHFQYLVNYDGERNEWSIVPEIGTKQCVVINGTPCVDGVSVPLHAGDVIEIGSRKNTVRMAPITVEFID